MLTKKEKQQCELCRISVARSLKTAPDNIIILPIFECLKRAIKGSTNGCIRVIPKGVREIEALETDYAPFIIDKLLKTGDSLFDNIVKEWHKR